MKRILATALAVLLIATMAISGSVAYLTSTDSDTNVFTMGEIKIEQHEKDSEGDPFENDQQLLPSSSFSGTTEPDKGLDNNVWVTTKDGEMAKLDNGEIDKIVTVENKGKNPAYVRTIFAFEDTAEIDTKGMIIKNWNKDVQAELALEEKVAQVLINGKVYNLYVYTYTDELAVGETTGASLRQVAMSAEAGNAEVEAIRAIGDGKYSILVATQAVQAENMGEMDAEAALNAAFGAITSANNPWMNGEVEGAEASSNVVRIRSKADLLALSGKQYYMTNVTFVLEDDIDMGGASMTRIGLDNVDARTTPMNVKFIGNGHTISNMKIESLENDAFSMSNAGLFELRGSNATDTSLTVENLTLKKITVSGTNKSNNCYGAAAVVGYMTDRCTVTLNNVDVYDSTITSSGNASVFVGYTTEKVTLTGCDAYNCKIKGETVVKTGTFVGTANTSNCTVKIENCINNATDLNTNTQAKDYGRTLNNAIVNGQGTVPTTATDSESLSTAISGTTNDTAYVKLSNATYDLPTTVSGKTVTLVGNGKDTKVKAYVAVYTGSATLHFENLTIQGGSENYMGFQHANKATYKNCVIDEMVTLYCESEFENCTFNLEANQYIWTYGASEVTFKNCTFNTKGKCILVYNEGGNGSVVNIKNCTMNASQKVDGKAAVEIDSQYLTGDKEFIININNSNANGFGNGSVSGNSLWNNKNGTRAKVYVNGVAQAMNTPS